jgi:hypothetical protein
MYCVDLLTDALAKHSLNLWGSVYELFLKSNDPIV